MILDLWTSFATERYVRCPPTRLTVFHTRSYKYSPFKMYHLSSHNYLFRIPYSDLLSSRWIPVNETSAETDVKRGYLQIKDGKAWMVSGSMPFEHRLKYLNEILV